MQTKLTLRMDDQLIKGAKKYAEQAGKSLSQMVAEYFSAVISSQDSPVEPTPTVARLRGTLKGTKIDLKDYRTYLEDKYL